MGSMKWKKGLLTASGIMLLLAHFNNCSEVSFSENDTYNKSTAKYNEQIEIVRNKCGNLKLETISQDIIFDDPRDEFNDRNFTCDFGNNGNLTEKDEYFQARLKQDRGINLPEGAVICDLEFNFKDNQTMEFDDHFLFLLNESVLATSLDTLLGYLPSAGEIPVYSWEGIKGQLWGVKNGSEEKFCLGSDRQMGRCVWPETEKEGRVEMDFSPDLIKEVMAVDLNRRSHIFSFVMLGDNDKGDCQHDRLEFNFKIQYVVPK